MPYRFACVSLNFLTVKISHINYFTTGNAIPTKYDSVTWPTQYQASGYIQLPYPQITEPFQAYYDLKSNVSRVDYYNGTVKTYQRPEDLNYGVQYKIVPETTETFTNRISCFQSNGTSDGAVSLQSIVPDMTDFEVTIIQH